EKRDIFRLRLRVGIGQRAVLLRDDFRDEIRSRRHERPVRRAEIVEVYLEAQWQIRLDNLDGMPGVSGIDGTRSHSVHRELCLKLLGIEPHEQRIECGFENRLTGEDPDL